jgi:cobalt-zinc-cadmium efflux system outer membrane protein
MCRAIVAIFCLVGLPFSIWAQRPALKYVSESAGVSLRELADTALLRNKDLQAARESLRQAEARLSQARVRPNPTLDISRTTDVMFKNEGDIDMSVTVSQEFELGGKRSKRINVEEASIEVAKADIANAERQLTGRLRVLFAEAIGAAARLDLFDRLDELNQQLVAVMTTRLRSGDASRLDSQLLAGETNQVSARRIVTQNQLEATLLQILTLAGLPENEGLVLRRPQQTDAFPETEASALARALETRPDLKALRLREALQEAGITLAKSQSVSNVTAFVRYGRESLPILVNGSSTQSFERENVMEFGVSIPLPFFNRQQGNIAEASSRRVQARAERESLEAEIRQEVLLAFRRYNAARRALDVLKNGVLQPNQESLGIIRLSYNLGEMRLLDVVNQQRVAVEAETSYIDAQTEFNSAIATLETAIAADGK